LLNHGGWLQKKEISPHRVTAGNQNLPTRHHYRESVRGRPDIAFAAKYRSCEMFRAIGEGIKSNNFRAPLSAAQGVL
jgi:hypothetical protein